MSIYTPKFWEAARCHARGKMEPAGTQVCVAMFMEDGALHGYTSPQGEFFPSIMEVIQKVCNLDYGGAKTEWQRIKRVAADNNAKCHKECADILQGKCHFHIVLTFVLCTWYWVHFVFGGLCNGWTCALGIGWTWYWVDLCTLYWVDLVLGGLVHLVLGGLGIGWTWYWLIVVNLRLGWVS